MPLEDYAPRPTHLKWLLDSDPAIRWQVMKDLTDEAPNRRFGTTTFCEDSIICGMQELNPIGASAKPARGAGGD
jgi:hypothetical protein